MDSEGLIMIYSDAYVTGSQRTCMWFCPDSSSQKKMKTFDQFKITNCSLTQLEVEREYG